MTTWDPIPFATSVLPAKRTVVAADGSDVRVLLSLPGGGMSHFSLAPGLTSRAVRHQTVEEIWFVVSGRGQMWRRCTGADGRPVETVVDLEPGVCLTVPVGTTFQFRAIGDGGAGDPPLAAVAVTMPPWPSDDEALLEQGPWAPVTE